MLRDALVSAGWGSAEHAPRMQGALDEQGEIALRVSSGIPDYPLLAHLKPSQREREGRTPHPLRVFGRLLLALNCPAGWQVTEHGPNLALHNPNSKSRNVFGDSPATVIATSFLRLQVPLCDQSGASNQNVFCSGAACQASLGHIKMMPDAGEDSTEQVPQQMRLTSLYRYPIKSARAEALEEAEITAEGLRGDRRFVVTLADGTGLTQRTKPLLATIEVCRLGDKLNLCASDGQTCNISMITSGKRADVKLFQDNVPLIDQGLEVGKWLEDVLDGGVVQNPVLRFLGKSRYRLFYAPDDSWQNWQDGQLLRAGAGLSDLAPLLLICEESLNELNARREAEGLPFVPLERFRPNLVVSGCPVPNAEADAWKRVRIGSAEFVVSSPCPRCTVPDVDQQLGKNDPLRSGPMRSLQQYRKFPRFGVTFGAYLTPVNPGATVRVGDEITVDE